MSHSILPFVSIIVVNYNGRHLLGSCLASLANLDYPERKLEVILVDNASTDGSVEYAREKFAWVRVSAQSVNHGFAEGCNRGTEMASGDYVAFLNNDIEVDRCWLNELARGISREENVAVCASKVLCWDARDVIYTAGGKIAANGAGYAVGYGEKDGAEVYNSYRYTGFAPGTAMLMKKDTFLAVGGFDVDYFACHEDADISWRTWLAGFKVLYVPSAVVYHIEGATFGSRSRYQPLRVYLATRNRLFTILKNLEMGNAVKAFLLSFLFDTYRLLMFTKNRNFASVKALLRAYCAFAVGIRKTVIKRKLVQKNRELSDKELYKLGVIATLRESIAEERRLRSVLRQEAYRS